MAIEDAEFNAYFSVKSLGSIMPPIVLMLLSGKKIPLKYMVIFFCLVCAAGQLMFIVGLQNTN
jgi:hypothetical protein